jgi:RNA polymerase sigma-70 factor (ECF subfamily)
MIIRSDVGDSFLSSGIRNDNMDCFEVLYKRYKSKLYFFSLKFLKDTEEAEDLVQTVFINLWEHRKSLDDSLSVKSYIYKSAVNAIYNRLKRKALLKRFIQNELKEPVLSCNPTYDKIFYDDLDRSIESVLDNMPLKQKMIFNLSRNEGLSHKEISDKLNLSVRTVENQIYRTIKRIKYLISIDGLYLMFLILTCE